MSGFTNAAGNVLQNMMGSAVALHRAGRTEEAIGAYRRVLAIRPDLFEAQINLGNLLASMGRFAEAIAAYGAAMDVRADVPEAHFNLGNALKADGQLAQAVSAYRRALALKPDFPQALFNLGNALQALGKSDEAATALRRAIRQAPAFAQAHNNLGVLLLDMGDIGEAEASFDAALRIEPRYAAAHNNLGMLLQKTGRRDASEKAYREAIRLQPGYREAQEQLGSLLLEAGRTGEAFEIFRTMATQQGRAGREAPAHKTRHDEEQQAWLGRPLPRAGTADGGGRVEGSAINLCNNIAQIESCWKEEKPQIVVIDNLLTPEALAGLRHFCLNSTIWNNSFDEGYVGAKLQSGFCSPLLAQIADDLARAYPAIFRDHPLLFAWAFKYDQMLKGTRIHADFAAVNVNFWITPDEANLDDQHGGLVVYDQAAPLDWNFARYNADEGAIRRFLADRNAQSVRVPYRANRAVIFDSDLFHETDVMHFAPGYANRRINVTLLYGVREDGKHG
jgi:tetratricopeptide (TPR) repeat protein